MSKKFNITLREMNRVERILRDFYIEPTCLEVDLYLAGAQTEIELENRMLTLIKRRLFDEELVRI